VPNSRQLQEVCSLMGIHQLNATAYHPQTDGLVERFNRTLTDMLAKTVTKDGADWDDQLPYVLLAYRAAAQESILGSHHFSYCMDVIQGYLLKQYCQLQWTVKS